MNTRSLILGMHVLVVLTLLSGCAKPVQKATSASVSTYPVTVESCGQPVRFESAPKRVVSFDTNMTEIMLALGLEDRMVGYWISGVKIADRYQEQIKNIPLISEVTWPPPSMEVILSFSPDFVFGGWGYNFSEESGVTPEKLASAGVKSYVLTETCIQAGVPANTQLDGTYQDILNLGRIFSVEDRAQTIVDQMRTNIEAVQKKIGKAETPLRGLYYGGGADVAFSCGKFGMASKMMDAVGAKNILADVDKDYFDGVSWETVIARDPEFIMIDDTPWESAAQRIATLKSLPKLSSITAIREGRFIVLPWTYILPGVDMDKGIAMLAEALYPDLFR